jgi:hypothetical protein
MQRTNIYLEDRQTAALDRVAAAEGVSRAEVIRRLIDEGLDGRSADLSVDLAWIEGSFGVEADLDVPDRGPGAREDAWERIARP